MLGAEVVHHDDAFWTWKRWIAEGQLSTPFRVVHVDAHADIGLGDAGWKYLLTELLALPVEQRSSPLHGSNSTMNAGNYLAFAVANGWVKDILYVYSSAMRFLNATGTSEKDTTENKNLKPGDLLPYHFLNCDPLTRIIELKHYTKKDADMLMMSSRKPPVPIHSEPAIDLLP